MNQNHTHTDLTFLSLARRLMEGGDPRALQNRLEALKRIVAPCSRAWQAQYTRLLEEAARMAALRELGEREVSPISQTALRALESLEAQFCKTYVGAGAQISDEEDLAIMAPRIDSAESPEDIRAITGVALCAIARRAGSFDRALYCTNVQQLLEEKILMEEMNAHPSPAMSLWAALRRAPVRSLAILLLQYDEAGGVFRSAAPAELVCMPTMDELRKALAVYETALNLAPQRERDLCQRDLCRRILQQAGLWLTEEALDQDPLFQPFSKAIWEYLWGAMDFLEDPEHQTGQDLMILLVRRLCDALRDREVPVPPVLACLLQICLASAADCTQPTSARVLEGGEGQ